MHKSKQNLISHFTTAFWSAHSQLSLVGTECKITKSKKDCLPFTGLLSITVGAIPASKFPIMLPVRGSTAKHIDIKRHNFGSLNTRQWLFRLPNQLLVIFIHFLYFHPPNICRGGRAKQVVVRSARAFLCFLGSLTSRNWLIITKLKTGSKPRKSSN